MSNQDTDEQRPRSTEDEFVEMALEFLRNIAFPWIWLYPDESLGRRLLNWWWVYGLFALGTGTLFYHTAAGRGVHLPGTDSSVSPGATRLRSPDGRPDD